MRPAILELTHMGRYPNYSDKVDPAFFQNIEKLLLSITPPVSNDEARALIMLFNDDDFYGIAWVLVSLVETAPNWPLNDCLEAQDNQWITTLAIRSRNRKIDRTDR